MSKYKMGQSRNNAIVNVKIKFQRVLWNQRQQNEGGMPSILLLIVGARGCESDGIFATL